MRGRHAAEPITDRTGRAVAVLGLLGLLPPAFIVGPQVSAANAAPPVPISRPDLAPHTDEPQTCRCGPRTPL